MTATEFLSEDNYGLHTIPTLFYFQYIFILSVDYASLSKTEYLRYYDCVDHQLCHDWLQQIHLLTGWLVIDESVMKFEISYAAARIGGEIHKIDFLIEGTDVARKRPISINSPASTAHKIVESTSPLHGASIKSSMASSVTAATFQNRLLLWNAFLRRNETVDSDTPLAPQLRYRRNSYSGNDTKIGNAGNNYDMKQSSRRGSLKSIKNITLYRLSVYDLCVALILGPPRYRKSEYELTERFIKVFAVVNLILPFLNLLINEGERFKGQTAADITYICLLYASASIVSYVYGLFFYRLMYTSIADVSRLYNMLHDLNGMIRTSDLMEDPQIGLSRMQSWKERGQSLAGAMLVADKRVSLLRQIRTSVSDLASGSDRAVHVETVGAAVASRSEEDDQVSTLDDTLQENCDNGDDTNQKGSGGVNFKPSLSSVITEAEDIFDTLSRINSLHMHSSPQNPRSAIEESNEGKRRGGKESANLTSSRGRLQRAKTTTKLLGECSGLVRLNNEPIVPPLSFRYAQNIVAWSYARDTILNFGLRFRFRINIFLGAVMFMQILLIVSALVGVFVSRGTGVTDARSAMQHPLLLQSVLVIVMNFAFLIWLVVQGSNVNELLSKHSQSLGGHVLRLHHYLEELRLRRITAEEAVEQGQADSERKDATVSAVDVNTRERYLQELSETIEHVELLTSKIEAMMSVVDVQTHAHPFTILGTTADMRLAAWIATIAMSFFSALFTRLFGKNAAHAGPGDLIGAI